MVIYLFPISPPLFADEGDEPVLPVIRDNIIKDKDGRTVAYFAENREKLAAHDRAGVLFNVIDNEGMSPLMYYLKITSLKKDSIDFLLDWEEEHSPGFSAEFDTRKDYCTALLTLLMPKQNWSSEEKAAVAKRLLDGGADAAARDHENTPIIFHIDFRTSLTGVVSLLIEHGAPVNERDRNGQTLLLRAIENKALVDFLLLHGADPNLQDREGKTALMHNWNGIYLLLQAGADPFIKDRDGKTLLHRWHYLLNETLLDELVSRGIDVDEPDNEGITPLMCAVERISGYENAIFTLLEKGADPNLRGPGGRKW